MAQQQHEFRRVEGLKPYSRNARTHLPKQISQIAAAIVEWGWTSPILIDESDGIIAGHGRWLGAKRVYSSGRLLRMADGTEIPSGMVPVIVARGWGDDEKRAYVLADNKIALNSGWDDTLLHYELDALGDAGFDLELTGFDIEVDADSGDAMLEDSQSASPDEGKFWVTIRGPLEDQARVLDAVKAALGEPGLVSIDIGSSAGPATEA